MKEKRNGWRLNERISSLETTVSSVVTKLDNFQADLTHVVTTLDKNSESNKTNWSTLTGIAAVLISIVLYHNSLVMAPVYATDTYQEKRIEKLENIAQTLVVKTAINETNNSTIQRSQTDN